MTTETAGPIHGADRAPKAGSSLRRHLEHLVPGLDEIREHEPLMPPLVLGWVVALVSAFSLRPFIVAALPADQLAAAGAVEFSLWIVALFAPAFQLVRAVALGVLAWALLVLADSARRFRAILSIVLYGDVILSVQGLLLAFYLHLTTGGGAGPQALQAPFGPAVFVPTSRPVLFAVAQSMTFVHVAWLAFLMIAFHRVLDLGRVRAAVFAAALWGGVLLVTVMRASFAF